VSPQNRCSFAAGLWTNDPTSGLNRLRQFIGKNRLPRSAVLTVPHSFNGLKEARLIFVITRLIVIWGTRGDQFAVHYLSTEVEAEKSYTYRELHREVCAFAAVLQSLGLQRGDRVVIYLPMIPEALFSLLACVRIGLVHSVVFAGFAPASLASRIDDAEAKLLITAEGGLRGGKLIPLKTWLMKRLR
jgi:hypothetical protein